MISSSVFGTIIWAMLIMAAVVFVSLYYVNAGYGQFRSRQWGWSINNRVAWMIMEAPVFFVMLAIWITSGASTHVPELVLFGLFELHYFQRSFVFPCLMNGHSQMPVVIMLMGVIFNTVNGILQGGALYWYPNPDYAMGAATGQYDLSPDRILASHIIKTDEYFADVCQQFIDGEMPSGIVRVGLESGATGIRLSPYLGDMIPQEIRDKMAQIEGKLISGEIVPPTSEEELTAYLTSLT